MNYNEIGRNIITRNEERDETSKIIQPKRTGSGLFGGWGPRLLTLALTAAALGASNTAGFAQSTIAYTNDPVKVMSYSIDQQSAIQLLEWGGTYSSFESPASLSISFVNGANVAASRVEFAVREGKETELVVDKGTFAPGTSITHEFALAPQFGNASAIELREVTFADGTTWQRG